MFYSVGFTQNLVYLERHLNGSVPTLMEDLSVLWSKEIYLRVWIWTAVYCTALVLGHFFSRFMQANCLMLWGCTFPRLTVTLTTQLYVSFSPNKSSGKLEAVTAIQHCVDDIHNWMTSDKLLLNYDKTEFLTIGTKQQLSKVNIHHNNFNWRLCK